MAEGIYRTAQHRIKKTDPIYTYLKGFCSDANNLYNAALFIQRQVMTGLKKESDGIELQPNEKEVIEKINENLNAMNDVRRNANNKRMMLYRKKIEEAEKDGKDTSNIKEPTISKMFNRPTKDKYLLGYPFLECFLKVTENPDYKKMLTAQAAQTIVKAAAQDMSNYIASKREYYANINNNQSKSDDNRNKPNLPKYKTSGGMMTVKLTNQDCRIKDGFLRFPKTDLYIKSANRPGKLKEVILMPFHGDIIVIEVMDITDTGEIKEMKNDSSRIMSIDVGVSNIAAITNNVGEPCLLFKGNVAKDINSRFNYKAAKIMSEQTAGTENKFEPTEEYYALLKKRTFRIHDFLHKTAKGIINYALKWNIDTIIYGSNKGWKQNFKNAAFVQIPFNYFKGALQTLCETNGIRFIETEESYTSRSSFLDSDPIPVYKEGEEVNVEFSGKRISRGRYKSNNHDRWINADLNGSANIGRKCIADMFTRKGSVMPNFDNVILVKTPYEITVKKNPNKAISCSKQKRLRRKGIKTI